MAKATKKQLGKGLGALLSSMGMDEEQAEDVKKNIKKNPKKVVKDMANTIAMIPLDAIEANPFNPRKEFEEGPLEELSASIKVHGLVQPITVRPTKRSKYQLISGERRWRASQRAGLSELPAYIRVVDNDQEMLEMALIENIQRENLNPIEIAITYQRLMDECDLTHEQLSERLGKGRSTITNKLGLLELSPDAIKALKAKEISEGHAKALKGLNKIDQQLFVLKQIKEKDLSVRATESLCTAMKNGPKKKKGKSKNPYQDSIDAIQRDMSKFFGTKKIKVNVNSKGKGSISIPVDDFDQLEFIRDKMSEDY